ncbi:hypothetical protein HC341_12030 [Aquisalimonas sp. 2447]|uniref:YdcF family protein n=1 Tax=Aquisalimonas sp. 2447 TaxID=2740807 RepID=UPI0014324A72|nr:hypothetical protein [Aquisalimonas sp. 2447]QIT55876.1 hypothetical protein HC341_12030 [Aquisalimonas sp. 2447]
MSPLVGLLLLCGLVALWLGRRRLGGGHAPDPAVPVSSRLDAMALFRAQGLDPVPAPTEYMAPARPPGAGWNVYYLRPSATGLRMTERAFHEYLGLAWGRVQGIL